MSVSVADIVLGHARESSLLSQYREDQPQPTESASFGEKGAHFLDVRENGQTNVRRNCYSRWCTVAVITCVVCLSIVLEARARQAEELEAVQDRLDPDDPLIVEAADGARISGHLIRISATDLEILTRAGSRTFSSTEIAALIRPRDSLVNGAIIGAAFFGASAAASVAWCGEVCDDKAFTIGSVAATGAVIGVGIDYLFGRETVLYRPTSSRVDFRAAPLLLGEYRGIHFAIRF